MKIYEPTITHQNNEIVYSVKIEMKKEMKELWYRISDEFEELISNTSDVALVALLIPAMSKGEDIYIDGCISEKLFYNISYRLQKLLTLTIPSLKMINIYPTKLQMNQDIGKTGVAAGFSGGIDSFCTLHDHYYHDVLDSFKLTHLTFFNTGSHGAGEKGEKLFQKRYSRLEPVAKQIGLPFIRIDSNLDSFYTMRKISYAQTHSVRNASIALLLGKGIKYYMYSSGYSYSDVHVKEGDIAHIDTIAFPLLSVENLEIFSVGNEYTRVEKTIRVAKVFDSYDTLDVCIDDVDKRVKNCSQCRKCLHTLTTLEIAGLIDLYSNSFDLDIYAKHKNKYFGFILSSNSLLGNEIVEYAKKEKFSFPFVSYIYMVLYKIKYHRKFLSKKLRGYFSKK